MVLSFHFFLFIFQFDPVFYYLYWPIKTMLSINQLLGNQKLKLMTSQFQFKTTALPAKLGLYKGMYIIVEFPKYKLTVN